MTHLAPTAAPIRLGVGLVLFGALVGCVGGPAHHDASWTPVRITNIDMVIGEWEGPITKSGDMLPSGSVRATIRENGSYLFAGQNADKVAVGTGSLEMRDGRLAGDTDRRAVSLTLYDHKGKAILVVESINHETGERYRGEFTRVQ